LSGGGRFATTVEMRRGWYIAFAKRLIQIAFGLLLGLVLAEVLLQVAALSTRSLRGGRVEGPIGDGRRIAFLGDSNTFGLGAGFKNSFPQVLQQRWQAPGQGAVEVLNLGTPGLNSSKLRQQLPNIFVSLQPNLLVIMIGVNDLWTAPVAVDGEEESWRYRLWKLSRVYRLLYMISKIPESRDMTIARRQTKAGPMISADDVQLVWTGKITDGSQSSKWNVRLQENLVRMIDDARQVGIATVLLTYPSDAGFYQPVNALIRETGALTHTPVVDVAAAFHEACPSGDCPDLFLADQHPTAKGHQIVADVVWNYLSHRADSAPAPALADGSAAGETSRAGSLP
jgi:lysophospholipase L1-like esterase